MKQIFKFFTFAAVIGLAACAEKPGYVLTGTVENAAEGDTVLLQERQGWNYISLDTAIITQGKFTFEGVQDTAVNRYLVCKTSANNIFKTDFFLENGKLTAELKRKKPTVTGTPNNDAYQIVKDEISEVYTKINELRRVANQAESLTDAQRDSLETLFENYNTQYEQITNKGIKTNIGNAVGVYLLKNNFYSMDINLLDSLMPQIAPEFQNTPDIIKIKNYVAATKATQIGQPFVDFTMKDPEGKEVKLSDYAGKGKVIVVDFWASWCGPCLAGMPALKETYKKYKGDKFEIVGVSLDKDEKAWKDAIKKHGLEWQHMTDLKFWDCEGARLYGISAIPHLVVIDKDGTIVARNLHGEELDAKIKELIAQ